MREGVTYLGMLLNPEGSSRFFDEKLADVFPALVYIYDVESQKLAYVNRKISDFLGFSSEEISDLGLEGLIFKDDLDRVKTEFEKYFGLKDEDSYSYDCRLNKKGGNWRHFHTIGTVLRRKEDGNASSFLFIAQDVTDQLKSAEEIQTVRELFDETEELLQFGSWQVNAGSENVTWTDGLYRLFEYTREEASNITREFCYKHIVPEDVARLDAAVKEAKETATGFECEYQIITKNGVTKTVSSKGKVIADDAGNFARLIGITRDITPMRNFERERERSIRELNRSNQELEEFAYVASHDLQEPLRKISTFSERLKMKFSEQLGQEGALFIDRILVSTENMRTLIDNLLEFSRASRSSDGFTLSNLNTLVKDVISDLELRIEETRTVVKISSLPEVEVVPAEIKQLFNNLLTNAIKFRKPDIDPVLEITSEPVKESEKELHHLPVDKEYVKIVVKDNGIGFEEEYAQRIFQIFQRLHGKSEYPGSGIGLAICKKIVDNHNGVLYAESSMGKGSAFHIILPEKQY